MTLFDAYKKPSGRKIEIWYNIQDKMLHEGGYNLHIVSYNKYIFTCAYYINTCIGTIKVTYTPTKTKREFID